MIAGDEMELLQAQRVGKRHNISHNEVVMIAPRVCRVGASPRTVSALVGSEHAEAGSGTGLQQLIEPSSSQENHARQITTSPLAGPEARQRKANPLRRDLNFLPSEPLP